MEKEQVYKQIESKLKETQELLQRLNNIDLEESHKKARKHVEDHFAKLMKALIGRRDQLLEKIDHIFKQRGTPFFLNHTTLLYEMLIHRTN